MIFYDASLFSIQQQGTNINNTSLAFLGFCLVLLAVIQDVKKDRNPHKVGR